MPWSETNVSKERVRFVLEWEKRWNEGQGVVNMSELCREFGISRECGHKHVRRYVEGGWDLEAVEERSRRPHRSPNRVEDEMEDLVVAARKLKPKWGPVKLRGWLKEQPNAVWCVDFKGWFLTGDGQRCYPLTISDAYSRYAND
jgi:transposase InsO family protein